MIRLLPKLLHQMFMTSMAITAAATVILVSGVNISSPFFCLVAMVFCGVVHGSTRRRYIAPFSTSMAVAT